MNRMQRIFSMVRGLGFLVLVFTFALLAASCEDEAAQNAKARLSGVKGDIRLSLKTTGNTVTPKEGDFASAGDVIETGEDGSTILKYPNGTLIAVHPGSRLEIARLETGTSGSVTGMFYKMLKGIIVYIVQPETVGKFEVQTDSAYASVKGTVFKVEVNGDGSTTLTVAAGTVEFAAAKDPAKAVSVSKANAATIKSDGTVSGPAAANVLADKYLSDEKVIINIKESR